MISGNLERPKKLVEEEVVETCFVVEEEGEVEIEQVLLSGKEVSMGIVRLGSEGRNNTTL